jgi:hypothetical protein
MKEDKVILFLDDNPNRAALMYQRMPPALRNITIWVQTAEEAIEVLENYKERLITVYLDHDLGGETYVHSGREDCGMEVVRFLEKQDVIEYVDCEFVIHSWNIPAAIKMASRLDKHGYSVIQIPFGQ